MFRRAYRAFGKRRQAIYGNVDIFDESDNIPPPRPGVLNHKSGWDEVERPTTTLNLRST
jgi:hypothetical protein